MKVDIAYPYILFLLIPALALCLFFGKKLRMGNSIKKRATIAMRMFLITLIVFAMAGISVNMRQTSVATVYLVDLSASTQDGVSEMTDFVRDAFANLPEEELAGVVAFGYDTSVECFVKKKQQFTDFESMPVNSATNMEQAITTAMTMYPQGCGKRLVLLTDGQENAGDVKNMLSSLSANSVVLEVKRIEHEKQKEVYISDVDIPETIHAGDTFKVEVAVESTVDTSAVISLYAGKKLKGKETVSLQKGSNRFVFKDKREGEGFYNYRAYVEAVDDTLALNNEYVAFTKAENQEKILLIEGREGNTKHFEKVLLAGNVEYDKVDAAAAPRTMQEFEKYKSIVMADVYAGDLPKGFMNNIESYVENYAGGLVAIGGENSFALGAYRDTPIEEVLPVKVDMNGEKEIPKMAVVLVIDHSGSMSEQMGGGSKLALAKESAVAALKNMRTSDELGVLSFDDTFTWNRSLKEIEDRDVAEKEIRSIQDGGGTSIYPAVQAAQQALSKSDANIKHIILLTDGQDSAPGKNYDDALAKMQEQKITLSSVAVGKDADTAILQKLAEGGEGNFYETDSEDDMPRIFANEIFLSTKSYLINREFTPVTVQDNGMLTDVLGEGLPTLLGYIGSGKKELATSLLVSDEQDPILTCWQFGLGKTVAFNSDVENIWTANFAKWEKYPLFWRNIINWTKTELDDDGSSLEIASEGQSAKLTYTSRDYKADTKVDVIVTDDEGKQQNYTLGAIKPGVYETDIQLDGTGVYSVYARESAGGETVAIKNNAVAVQYSREYRVQSKTENFDSFLKEAGAVTIKSAREVYGYKPETLHSARNLTSFFLVLALLLFAWDVTARRLSLSLISLLYDRRMVHEKGGKFQKKVETLKDTAPKETRQKETEPKETIPKDTAPKKETKGRRKEESKETVKEERSSLDMATLLQKKKERRKNEM